MRVKEQNIAHLVAQSREHGVLFGRLDAKGRQHLHLSRDIKVEGQMAASTARAFKPSSTLVAWASARSCLSASFLRAASSLVSSTAMKWPARLSDGHTS